MRKFISVAACAAIVMFAGSTLAKNPHPTDTDPVTGLCSFFIEGDVWLYWDDTLDEGEKYGGDMEIETSVLYTCIGGSETELLLSLEVDLDQDEAASLSYACDGTLCGAHSDYDIDWGPDYDAAVDAAVAAACGGAVNVEGYSDEISSLSFGVKEMNPGAGRSQDKIKAKIEIYPLPNAECAI